MVGVSVGDALAAQGRSSVSGLVAHGFNHSRGTTRGTVHGFNSVAVRTAETRLPRPGCQRPSRERRGFQ